MRSEITSSGIPTTLPFSGMQNYVYGLSDFWKSWFEDLEVVERTLEATSYQLADAYSRFIQACSSVSLFDINETMHASIKLLLIDESERVEGTFAPTYYLKEKVLDATYLLDRPMLSRKAYEKGVHFNIIKEGTQIEFYQELSSLGFPSRTIPKTGTANGVTQYSVWASDSQTDEQALYEYFGNLVRVSPQTSTEVYKNYIQGLFFLYTNGPTIELLSRGLHLSLGIPLVREVEVVLLVKQDEETGNYLVVTENNSYTVPYGIVPTVVPNEMLVTGAELARVAYIVDHLVDGNWWVNLRMPAVLFPGLPSPRIAAMGTFEEYAMRKYLKTHTFLVRIDLSGTITTDAAAEISRLILDAKPTYTLPVFVWSVQIESEDLLDEDPVSFKAQINAYDMLVSGEYLTRNHLEADIVGERDSSVWIRGNGDLVGSSSEVVDVSHVFQTSFTDDTPVSIPETDLLPLYNVNWAGLYEILYFLEVGPIPSTSPPFRPRNRFLISSVNLSSWYDYLVTQRDPISIGEATYNLKEIGAWQGELLRAFIPNVADITNTETLAIMYCCEDLYSVFLVRLSQTLFTPVFFPPAEEDPLTITQVPV